VVLFFGGSLLASIVFLFTSIKDSSPKFMKYVLPILTLLQTLSSTYLYTFHLFPNVLYYYFQIVWFINQYNMMNHPKLRGTLYNMFVSWPAGWWMGVCWMSLFLLPFHFHYHPILGYSLVVFVTWGLYQSLTSPSFGSHVDIDLDSLHVHDKVTHLPTPSITSGNPITIFQITDPHIGSYMSVKRLRSICEKVVQLNPDLVFLTGDFFTREAHHEVDALKIALEPLKAMKGRVVACLGNHDYECLENTLYGLKESDVILLQDEEVVLKTDKGSLQILGSTYTFGGGDKEHLETLFAKFPKNPNCKFHFTLLHNPIMFKHVPRNYGTIVFSGHLHGSQIQLALKPLGFNVSFLRH
jgi:predicted phosphodiesterase